MSNIIPVNRRKYRFVKVVFPNDVVVNSIIKRRTDEWYDAGNSRGDE